MKQEVTTVNEGLEPRHGAMHGNVGSIFTLLDAGADPNTKDLGNKTPLHYACAGGHTDLVRFLLRRCATCATDVQRPQN